MLSYPKQAIVKVTSFRAGISEVSQVLNYISREGSLEMHRSNGQLITGKEDQKQMLKSWEIDFSNRKNARDVMHMVVSTPIGTNRENAAEAGRVFARNTFGCNWDYVVVAHDDEEHPHSHIVVKMRGIDGERLRTEKADLRQWRYQFAEACVEQGIAVSASPRYVRGRIRRSTPSKLWHSHSKGVSRVVQSTVKDAMAILTSPAVKAKRLKEMPWIVKINDRLEKEDDAFRVLQNQFTEKVKAADYYDKADIRKTRDDIANHRRKFQKTESTQRGTLMKTAQKMLEEGWSKADSITELETQMMQLKSPERNNVIKERQKDQLALQAQKVREQDQGWEI